MTALDPVAYLRETAPFHALPEPLFRAAAAALEIVYHPAGSWLARKGADPLEHLYVIRKGAVRLERGGQTLQLLEEGEIFGFTSLLTQEATLDVLVEEDLLAYRLPRAEFNRLLTDAQFAGHFAGSLAVRLRNSLEQSQVATFQADLSMQVLHLVRRPPVKVGPDATVGEAARVMREERVDSVLVGTDPPGIVTDRDFRNRVLAEGLGPDVPVTRIYTPQLCTVTAETPIYEAWAMLIDSGRHHLPVVRAGEVVGVISSNDLLKATAQGPVALLRRVERLASRASLPGYARRIVEMSSALLAGGLDAGVIAGFVARLNDALVQRILRWAEADLGAPPCRYAWMVFGSEGRMEQALLTDQDNALVYAAEGPGHAEYFQALAEKVNGDLESAGFPQCPGGYMARNWCLPLPQWERRFRAWASDPRPESLLCAGVFFDFRRVGGALDLGPLEEAVQRAQSGRVLLACMARAAMDFRPPASLMLRLKGGSSVVDLKKQGISPIVFLARCYGLEVGSSSRRTLDRLDAAVRAGLLDQDTQGLLAEAYRFLLGLRLRLQLRQVAQEQPPTSEVQLGALSAIERSRLKEAFHAIESWQESAAYHYRTDLF